MTQLRFDPLQYGTAAEAKAARDMLYRMLRKVGRNVYRWTLKNQLRQYAGLGIPDGRVRDVYYLQSRDGLSI